MTEDKGLRKGKKRNEERSGKKWVRQSGDKVQKRVKY